MSESGKAVFLSYASQDAEAAKRIADALRQSGVEVWFDAEGGLEHGDEWDAKIRRQIKECVLFLPIISANTQAREEGYFRIEWELAAQRALGIASGVAFILPVVIDGTREPEALVPDRFRTVQWTKLPGGVVPADVLARFLKLWSHRAGALKHSEAVGRDLRIPPVPDEAGFSDPVLQKKPTWPRYALAGLAMLLVMPLLYLALKPRRSPEEIAPPVAPAQPIAADAMKAAETKTVAAPASDWPHDPELKRAIALIDGLESTLEDYRLADEISARVVGQKPSDPEAVTVRARVNSAFVMRNFDFSTERTAQAKRFGERAVQLSPDDPQALYALSIFLHDRAGDDVRAEAFARRATELAPDNPRFWRQVMRTVNAQRRDEGLALAEEIVRRFPRDVLSHYELSIIYRDRQLWDKFEQETDATIALFPLANALNWKARAALVHGDLPEMRRWIDRVPARARAEERTVITSLVYATLSGDYAFGLKSLQGFAEPWFYDANNYSGPATLPRAMLLAQQGKTGLAREQYEVASAELARHRAENPSDQTFRRAEVWITLGLGRSDEAQALFHTYLEGFKRPIRVSPIAGWCFDAIPMGLLVGDRTTAVQLIREAAATAEGRNIIRQRMQADARMAPFRDDPEITALLAEPVDGKQQTENAGPKIAVATPAADWPKDPDLQRAEKILNAQDVLASDVAVAEDITKTVLAARPADVEATIVMGQVQVYYLVRGFDRTEDRFASAKHYAERARALAPDDPAAMVVMATYLYRRGVELPRAAKLFRAAIALRPAEPLYYRMLDNVLSITPGVTDGEIIASAKVTAERFPADVLVQYELARHYRDAGMLEEAERYFDIAIKLGPVANAIIARARLMLFVHGDPAGMKTLLDQLPDRYLGTDRAVFSLFTYAMATGQPQLGLDALQALPEAWMIDFDYTGPTALLAGELLLQQGRPELARLRFADALVELGRHKTDLSRNFSTTWLETFLLMRLGRLDEARKRNAVFFPELERPFHINLGTNWWFNPIAQNLLLGERANALALIHEMTGFPHGRAILRNTFRFDPRMAPFRDDLEIKAVLAEPSVAKAMNDRPAAFQITEDERQGPVIAVPLVDSKSVAVLAFANLSDDKANEYFSDGISEELLNVLAKVKQLKVAARTSSFSFKGQNVPVPEIASKLGVAYVVEGSVRKAGNKVRITAQLIKAADGFHVWSETYDRELKDIFAVQDEIAKNVLEAVKGSLIGGEQAPQTATTKIEAYTLYLQGQGELAKRGEVGLREAIRLFDAALAIDPDYIPALVGLARAAVVLPNYASLSGAEARGTVDRAKAAAARVLELDPRNAAAYTVLGWAHALADWHWSEGEAELLKAKELAPNDPWVANFIGDYYRFVGDNRASIAAKQLAWQLDPLSRVSHWDLGFAYVVAGDYDQAIHWGESAIALAPHNFDSYQPVILAAMHRGQLDLMRRTLGAARQNTHEDEGFLLLYEVVCAIAEKDTAAARRFLGQAEVKAQAGQASSAYAGYCHLLLGDSAEALRWLQLGYDRRDQALIWIENIDYGVIVANPVTKPILDLPGLKELYELRQRNARANRK